MMFSSSWDLTEPLKRGTTIDRFEIFRPLPSTGYIEHWQLDLQFRAPYTLSQEMHRSLRKFRRWKRIDVDRIFIREGILEVVAQLAKLKTLGSVKIKFPCFCSIDNTSHEDYDDSWSPTYVDDREIPEEEAVQLIHDVLEPLKTLYFQGPVMFIAAKPLANSSQSVDSPKYQTEDIQCQQAACLAFVAKFDKLVEFLGRSSLPRAQLSAQHHTWLEIKHRAAKLSCAPKITDCLLHLWTRAKFNQDVIGTAPGHKSNDSPRRAFTKSYKIAATNLKAAIKKERIADAEELERVKAC
ncbi:MAG: hypothetical protein L6R38_005616 [Xanthoria sp. 2 TBL-2021]|nr:MAG: hypothetical protein L6R38_005616 [Xanthoria sp. 2 TBL-2021]